MGYRLKCSLLLLCTTFTLVGCTDVVDQQVQEVSNMTIGEAVQKGTEIAKDSWEISKELATTIQNNKDAIWYIKDVTIASLPLVSVYIELNTLYVNPDTYAPEEWLTIYERNSAKIVEAKNNLQEIAPPTELAGFHQTYIDLLQQTITINESIANTVEKTGEVPLQLLTQFQQLQTQFEAIQQEIEAIQTLTNQ